MIVGLNNSDMTCYDWNQHVLLYKQVSIYGNASAFACAEKTLFVGTVEGDLLAVCNS